MKKKIMMVLALLSGCYIICINLIYLDNYIKTFKSLKEHLPKLAITSSVSLIADVLLGLSIITIILYEYIPKFKIIKHFILVLLILTYSYANLNTLSGISRVSYSFRKNEIFQNALLYLSTIVIVSAIVLYAFFNIIHYSSTRKYAKYYCLIVLIFSYLTSWITKYTGLDYYMYIVPASTHILSILSQLSVLLIMIYGLRENNIPSLNYIEIKFSKRTKKTLDESLITYDQTEEVSITTEQPAIEKQIEIEESIDSIKHKSIKIHKKYLFIAGIIAYITTCAIYIFTGDNKFEKFNLLAFSVLLFFSLVIVLFLLLIDKKKNANPKGKVLKEVLVVFISILYVIVAGYYFVNKIAESSFENVYRSLLHNKDLEVVYVKDGESTRVHIIRYGLFLNFPNSISDSKRSIYFNKIKKGSKYMIIKVSDKYKIELYPFDNDSIIMKVNRAKGIDVTYLLDGYNFDKYCEMMYEVSDYGILKNDYEDLSTEMKKELLSSALTSIDDKDSLCTRITMDYRDFYRKRDVYAHASRNATESVYYKEGYLYIDKFTKDKYKTKYDLDTDLFLKKEAEYLATVKEIIEMYSDQFKLQDKKENGEHIIYIDKDVTIKGTTTHYFLELTFVNQELTYLYLSHKKEYFSLRTEKGYGDYNSLYEYLRYPDDLSTYELKE